MTRTRYQPPALALHWNGHRWQQVPTASLGTMNARLDSVAVVTAKDAWAVGYAGQDTLIEHWNGTRWLRAASPNPPGQDLLGAVTAISPDDIWAVGEDYTSGSTGDTTLTLAEHWNGSSWTQVPAKNPGGTGESYFSGVSAISPDSIWAVGVANPDPQDFAPDQTLAEHWNGSSWQVVPSPDPGHGPLGNDLNDVAAISAKDAWAVGVFDGGATISAWPSTGTARSGARSRSASPPGRNPASTSPASPRCPHRRHGRSDPMTPTSPTPSPAPSSPAGTERNGRGHPARTRDRRERSPKPGTMPRPFHIHPGQAAVNAPAPTPTWTGRYQGPLTGWPRPDVPRLECGTSSGVRRLDSACG